jgi:hypothetical protein
LIYYILSSLRRQLALPRPVINRELLIKAPNPNGFPLLIRHRLKELGIEQRIRQPPPK